MAICRRSLVRGRYRACANGELASYIFPRLYGCIPFKSKMSWSLYLTPPQGGDAKISVTAVSMRSSSSSLSGAVLSSSRYSKQSPWTQVIRWLTSYTSALCCAHASVAASFSMAMIFSHLPDSAKAMTLPPAPAKRSISVVADGFALFARSSATLLELGVRT